MSNVKHLIIGLALVICGCFCILLMLIFEGFLGLIPAGPVEKEPIVVIATIAWFCGNAIASWISYAGYYYLLGSCLILYRISLLFSPAIISVYLVPSISDASHFVLLTCLAITGGYIVAIIAFLRTIDYFARIESDIRGKFKRWLYSIR